MTALPPKALCREALIDFLLAILESHIRLKGQLMTAKAVIENSELDMLSRDEFLKRYPGMAGVKHVNIKKTAPLLAEMGLITITDSEELVVTSVARDWYEHYQSNSAQAEDQLAAYFRQLWFVPLAAQAANGEHFADMVRQHLEDKIESEQISTAYALVQAFNLLYSDSKATVDFDKESVRQDADTQVSLPAAADDPTPTPTPQAEEIPNHVKPIWPNADTQVSLPAAAGDPTPTPQAEEVPDHVKPIWPDADTQVSLPAAADDPMPTPQAEEIPDDNEPISQHNAPWLASDEAKSTNEDDPISACDDNDETEKRKTPSAQVRFNRIGGENPLATRRQRDLTHRQISSQERTSFQEDLDSPLTDGKAKSHPEFSRAAPVVNTSAELESPAPSIDADQSATDSRSPGESEVVSDQTAPVSRMLKRNREPKMGPRATLRQHRPQTPRSETPRNTNDDSRFQRSVTESATQRRTIPANSGRFPKDGQSPLTAHRRTSTESSSDNSKENINRTNRQSVDNQAYGPRTKTQKPRNGGDSVPNTVNAPRSELVYLQVILPDGTQYAVTDALVQKWQAEHGGTIEDAIRALKHLLESGDEQSRDE